MKYLILFLLLLPFTATASAQGTLFSKAKGTKGKCECLLQWTNQLKREYPQMDLRRSPVNRLQLSAVNLFADPYFVPVFEKPFDELSPPSRLRIAKAIQNCLKHPDYQADFAWQRYVILNPFAMDRGNMSLEEMARMVSAQRGIRSQYSQTMHEIEGLSGEQGYNRLQQISRTAPRQFLQLWPSEQAALEEMIEDRKSLLAESALEAQWERVLAQVDSRSKALQIRQFDSNQYTYFQASGPAFQQQIRNHQTSELNALLARLMALEKQKIDGFATQAKDLSASNQWHDGFVQAYLNTFKRPQVEETYAYYLQQREAGMRQQFSTIRAAFERAGSFGEIDELESMYRYVSLPGSSLPREISQLAANRKQALKAVNLGKPAYAWFQVREASRGVSPGELINRIRAVAVEPGPYQQYIEAAVRATGKTVDPKSNFIIRIESNVEPLLYYATNVSTGERVQEEELEAYELKMFLVANGEVYRKGLIVRHQVALNSGVIARILKKGSYRDLAESRASDVRKLVRDLFEQNNNYQDPMLNDATWQRMLQAEYQHVEKRYAAYQQMAAISSTHNLVGIREIGDFSNVHNQSQAIAGLEAMQALKQNQMMQLMDDLFFRGQAFGNNWNAYTRWRDGLAEIDIPLYRKAERIVLPTITQEISGTTLRLGGSQNATVHALMSHSYLSEPHCLIPLDGTLYRVSARSLSDIRIHYALEDLMGEVVDMTRKSILRFSTQLGQYNRAQNSSGTVAYAPKPLSYQLEVQTTVNSDIRVEKGDKVEIHASGSIVYGLFAGAGGPDGIGGFTQYNRVPGHRHGALLVSIGKGEWMTAGTRKQILVQQAGRLQFLVNDKEPQNNQGRFSVSVNVFKRK